MRYKRLKSKVFSLEIFVPGKTAGPEKSGPKNVGHRKILDQKLLGSLIKIRSLTAEYCCIEVHGG